MKRTLSLIALLLCGIATVCANDGLFYTNGNQLVPTTETDIRLESEVLTIKLADDGVAYIDVLYTLYNPGSAKTLCVGFESDMSYNADYYGQDLFKTGGKNPYIKDFSVELNGKRLSYRNAVTQKWSENDSTSFRPIEGQELLSVIAENKDNDYPSGEYSYTYYFDATFPSGRSVLHHTYRYLSSYSVGTCYEIPYSLTPAARWAGGTIGDFTLIIDARGTYKHFMMPEKPFGDFEPQFTVEGAGKFRGRQPHAYHSTVEEGETELDIAYTEMVLRNAKATFHKKDFRPVAELTIFCDPQAALFNADDHAYSDRMDKIGAFYDRSALFGYTFEMSYLETMSENPLTCDIAANLPFATRGHVFKREDLKNFFERQWWYMPDPKYVADYAKLTKVEKEWIKKARDKKKELAH